MPSNVGYNSGKCAAEVRRNIRLIKLILVSLYFGTNTFVLKNYKQNLTDLTLI